MKRYINKIFRTAFDGKRVVLWLLGFKISFRYIMKPEHKVKMLLQKKRKELSKTKRKIQVYILIHQKEHWSMQTVYEQMKNDPAFEVRVVVLKDLFVWLDKENKEKCYSSTIEFFKSNNIDVLTSEEAEISDADIIIYQCHWMQYTEDKFKIENLYEKSLCVSIPYGMMSAAIQNEQFNQEFHNLCWINCCETVIHKELFKKYQDSKGKNAVVTGYPKLDKLYKEEHKAKETVRKKIIYAPHYSINTNFTVDFATFHLYYKQMLELAKKNTDIDFVLKPHPFLRSRVIFSNIMTENEYENYLNQWSELPNGFIQEDGNYMKLFASSDGMILDSISFISEYMFLNKPILFLNKYKNKETLCERFNEFGQKTLDYVYFANEWNDVEKFTESTIKQNFDPLHKERGDFADRVLKINYGKSGEFITNYIKKELKVS